MYDNNNYIIANFFNGEVCLRLAVSCQNAVMQLCLSLLSNRRLSELRIPA